MKSTEETLNTDLHNLVKTLKNKVNLKDTILKVSGREWIITAIKPDKIHSDLKVFYKDTLAEKENKVSLYDFHKKLQLPLFNLILSKINL